MLLPLKNLKKLPVETASGLKLGHISDIVLELDGQLMAQYEVKHSLVSGKKYLINRDQIVRFEDKKIIVDDSVEKVPNSKFQIPNSTPEPVSMRKGA